MKISRHEYADLIEVSAQKDVLIREMKARVKMKSDYISFEALKTIFDLWDIVPEVIRSDDNNIGSDTDV